MKQFILFLLLPAITLAQIPDPQPNTYVNDLAGVLSTYQVGKINEQVHQLETRYSVQLAIVLIKEFPANYEIEDYARELGRKWHVGNARNGLVYVAAINQRKQRLEVAANLEGLIPDITARHLTENLKPFFRNKDYAGGLLNMVKEIDDIVNPEAQEQRKLAEAERQKNVDNAYQLFLTILFWLIGIGGTILIIFWILHRRKKKAEPIEPKYTSSTIASRYAGSNYVAPVIVNNENNYSSGYSKSDDDRGYSGRSSDSGSSDFGNWGSGSSDSSSDSGFSGGGSTNDW